MKINQEQIKSLLIVHVQLGEPCTACIYTAKKNIAVHNQNASVPRAETFLEKIRL